MEARFVVAGGIAAVVGLALLLTASGLVTAVLGAIALFVAMPVLLIAGVIRGRSPSR